MLQYTIRRFLGAWPTLLILITMAFFLTRAAPGGPFDTEKTLPPEIQANLDKKYHLDEPVWMQYGRYLYDLT
ncbi:MAG: oligopeptide transporter permease, partial [Gammaproteobacteria bacterium]|nr:oligopeptide transporter permease [Gammaproteobacteria bacterium]